MRNMAGTGLERRDNNIQLALQGSYQSVKTLKPSNAKQDSETMQQTFTFQNKRRRQSKSTQQLESVDFNDYQYEQSQLQNLKQKRMKVLKLSKSKKRQALQMKKTMFGSANDEDSSMERQHGPDATKDAPELANPINNADIRPCRFDMLKRDNRN